VNTLAPSMLTALIDRPDRSVYLSSGLHRGGEDSLHDLDWTKRAWDPAGAYAESKLQVVALAFLLARRWPKVLSNAVDPGWVRTQMGDASAPVDIDTTHRGGASPKGCAESPVRLELKGDIPMDYTHLGRTGLKVSRLALGTMNFGELTDEKNSFAIMEASLRRLKTDHIDLYQMHHIDRATPWEEIWQAMEQLIREGKITYVGSSNFAGWDIATAQCAAVSRNLLGLASEQSLYNLTQRTIELEVIPALCHFGVGLIPWRPIGMGLLGGVLRQIAEGRRASPLLQQQIEKLRPKLEAHEALCDELGEAPSDVALAWLLHDPVVTAAISGPRTVEQLRQNLKGPSLVLSRETRAKLDEIWPGPGGEAPVAYAW
jgi:aryl-alcohol dehydrogenase-like predicted oxidoreductase